jgi:hypothetical protein
VRHVIFVVTDYDIIGPPMAYTHTMFYKNWSTDSKAEGEGHRQTCSSHVPFFPPKNEK